MPRLAILTPDPADLHHEVRWANVVEINAAPLRAAGFAVEQRVWTDPGDLTGFDLVLPLLAWGYPRAHERWVDAVRTWAAAGVRLHNPASVLIWNSDKAYLGRLGERGVPVVPTVYAERIDAALLEETARIFGTDRLVAKPRISAGAWETIRWSPGDPLTGGPSGPAMIQPYLAQIESEGEVSILYFGGRFSHAIAKRPQPGDFRVQPEYDGIITAHVPTRDERAVAERVLAQIEEPLLYARVDLVHGPSGPMLIEIELIEPDLYLGYDPAKGAAFAVAATELIGG
ncbi:ATP-grasp domain-containing protein [Allosphingosinicella deserti]|uniref:Transporter n=1 Tax=Allosphingosinicella deserti TaxID=2116704 RepID=A0A2P7QYG2_9SPHN|nr:transporter [Sphingomonas deserti]PSJ42997.1 transporter [Sphingomonas deserti]